MLSSARAAGTTGPRSFEVLADGFTVWINASDGSCVGRFGRGGIDIHTSATAQLEGAPQCKLCTHGRPTQAEWAIFKEKILEFYGVRVSDGCRPVFLGQMH